MGSLCNGSQAFESAFPPVTWTGNVEWKTTTVSHIGFTHQRLCATQMEDINAWECGRPVISDRPPGSSEADDVLGLDHDALNGTLSAFEQNSFGIQSAFHVDSDSDEVHLFLSFYTSGSIACLYAYHGFLCLLD